MWPSRAGPIRPLSVQRVRGAVAEVTATVETNAALSGVQAASEHRVV